MRSLVICLVVVCVMTVVNLASAEIIRGINMFDFVSIGNAGNAANSTGYGAVDYNYRIGMYEVTNAQWNSFTALAGAPTGTDGGYARDTYYGFAQQPTNCVSWYEVAQFCNYLTSGDKSEGAYQFSGNNSNADSFLGINRTAAQITYGTVYVIPTENEWYKAAYFKPDGSGYSLYANGTDTAPIAKVQSNYEKERYLGPWNVGTGTQEQNETYDMMGNMCEWTETRIGGAARGVRGGTFWWGGTDTISSLAYRNSDSMDFEELYDGFRVASIPEPATLSLLGLGLLALRRKS